MLLEADNPESEEIRRKPAEKVKTHVHNYHTSQQDRNNHTSHVNKIPETLTEKPLKIEYGPFHCVVPFGNHATLQSRTDEEHHWILKGAISPFTGLPQICAFRGEMDAAETGFEFYTNTQIDSDSPAWLGRWSGAEPREGLTLKNNKAFIKIRISKNTS